MINLFLLKYKGIEDGGGSQIDKVGWVFVYKLSTREFQSRSRQNQCLDNLKYTWRNFASIMLFLEKKKKSYEFVPLIFGNGVM